MSSLSDTIDSPASTSFFGLTRESLAGALGRHGQPGYRASQLYTWVYRRHQRDPAQMTDLPGALRRDLPAWLDLGLPAQASVLGTPDDLTHKFVLDLADRARVECLSSQVGCALRCSFCATGLMGLKRNLSAGEIVAQVVTMGEFHGWRDERFNLVFMGMGEPLANYEPVVEAVRIMRDPEGLNLGARRITISTSGVVPQMRRLAEERIPVGLAVSLHATTDAVRDQLVPINRRWPLEVLIPAARDYGRVSGRRVTLEYTLIAGVNDAAEDADRLGAIARELPSKINLIPYNPVPGLEWRRPTATAVDAFAQRLYPRAPAVTVRHTMGGEIWAACGQLGGLSA